MTVAEFNEFWSVHFSVFLWEVIVEIIQRHVLAPLHVAHTCLLAAITFYQRKRVRVSAGGAVHER